MVFEADEAFVLNLSVPVNATIADAQGTGTILNDDGSLIVTTTADTTNTGDGLTSLREAITFANASPDSSTITFSILGAGVQTIVPTSALPAITAPVIINGYTQGGATANTLAVGNDAVINIVLDGRSAGVSSSGLIIQTFNSIVRGLVINNFSGDGIQLSGGATGNSIEGCFLGTNAAGTADLGNGNGVRVRGAANGNTIGGLGVAERNLISGNNNGVRIEDANTDGNILFGNYIGTNKNGTAALGNATGVSLGSVGNAVGGTLTGAGNLISGNTARGISDVGDGSANATGNTIQGNIIGLNATQTAKVGNNEGVVISSRDKTLIGGTFAGRNIIAGNTLNGVTIFSNAAAGPENIVVQFNDIGTNASDDPNLGNGSEGIFIGATGCSVLNNTIIGNGSNGIGLFRAASTIIQQNNIGFTGQGNSGAGIFLSTGSQNNVIGGTAIDSFATSQANGNLIAGNGGPGVNVFSSDNTAFATGNSIRGNTIENNAGLGIDLRSLTEAANTPTPNDVQDPDTGNNNLQNFPVITNISGTTITGTLNSTPSTTFVLDFYENNVPNAAAAEGSLDSAA